MSLLGRLETLGTNAEATRPPVPEERRAPLQGSFANETGGQTPPPHYALIPNTKSRHTDS
jgi:hypothetical protein